MKKSLLKAVAVAVITALAVTCFPIYDLQAAQSFVFPAAGGALAAGNGRSIKDIRADVARNAAKQSTIANHEKITKKDTATVEKVETPSSKAVNEGITINGVAVVGSASEGATIEITEDSNQAVKSSRNDKNGGDDTELAEGEEKAEEEAESENKSAEEANPTIDVKPEAADVEEGEEDLSDQVIAVVDGYVNVRSMPDENSEIVGKLYNHSAGTWLDKQGDWYKIESGNVIGFVKGEYVKTGQGTVTKDKQESALEILNNYKDETKKKYDKLYSKRRYLRIGYNKGKNEFYPGQYWVKGSENAGHQLSYSKSLTRIVKKFPSFAPKSSLKPDD